MGPLGLRPGASAQAFAFLVRLLYKAIDPHRRAVGGGPPRGPGPQ